MISTSRKSAKNNHHENGIVCYVWICSSRDIEVSKSENFAKNAESAFFLILKSPYSGNDASKHIKNQESRIYLQYLNFNFNLFLVNECAPPIGVWPRKVYKRLQNYKTKQNLHNEMEQKWSVFMHARINLRNTRNGKLIASWSPDSTPRRRISPRYSGNLYTQ